MSDFTAHIKAELGNLSKIEGQIKNLGKTEIKLTNVQIGDTTAFTKAIQNALKNIGIKIDSKNVDFSGVETAAKASAQKVGDAFAQSLTQLKSKTLSNNIETWLKNNDAAAAKFEATLKNLQNKLQTNQNAKFLTQARAEFANIKSTAQAAGLATSGFAKQAREAAEATTKIRSATLSNQITTWMNKNTAAASQFGDRLREIQNSLKNNTDPSKLTQLRAEFARIKSEAQAAGLTTNSFVQSLKNIALQTIGITSAAMAIRKVIQEIKQLAQTAIEIDTAMNQLQIVTGATDAQMSKFLTSATKMATQLGNSITDVLGSMETFSRLGYDLNDSSVLSKFTGIMKNVAAVTQDEATTGITAIIKGYQMQVSDAERVADVLVKVGQRYAISAGELMTAFEKSGAALNATGLSFEKSAALLAAANASIQDANVVGRVLPMRTVMYV